MQYIQSINPLARVSNLVSHKFRIRAFWSLRNMHWSTQFATIGWMVKRSYLLMWRQTNFSKLIIRICKTSSNSYTLEQHENH